MHVALTGVSGFIGSVIARHLSDAGHTVTGLARSSSRRDHVERFVERFVVGSQDDESIWNDLLDRADCVIHNSLDWSPIRAGDLDAHLRSNLTASIKLLHASAPRQFVFISSVAVHHDMRPRWEGLVDEDHPMRPATLYGACKAAIETHLWAAHFSDDRHTSALRPCAVYGIDPRFERSIGYPIIETIRAGKPFTRSGGGKFVHVDDVAQAVVATLGNPDANGRVYNLADCYARWADLAQMAAEVLGVEAEIDFSSPPSSKNTFTKHAVHELGVPLDRGHDGLREHMRELIERMDARE
jgi:nucleoside-diphosphate-sugar epimerase